MPRPQLPYIPFSLQSSSAVRYTQKHGEVLLYLHLGLIQRTSEYSWMERNHLPCSHSAALNSFPLFNSECACTPNLAEFGCYRRLLLAAENEELRQKGQSSKMVLASEMVKAQFGGP